MHIRGGIYVTKDSLDNWHMAKCHTKPNKDNWNHKANEWGGVIVKPEEVLRKLEEDYGIRASQRSLQDYAKKGLIAKPTRKALGQGAGSISDYKEDAHKEYYGSWKLIHALKYKSVQVMEIRSLANTINEYLDNNTFNNSDEAINGYRELLLSKTNDKSKVAMAEFLWVTSGKEGNKMWDYIESIKKH